jgi:hypothetical protein
MLIGSQDKVLNAHDLAASYQSGDYVHCRLTLGVTCCATQAYRISTTTLPAVRLTPLLGLVFIPY